MLKAKRGASIISLALATVAIALTTTALVVATNNAALYRAQVIENKQPVNVETTAYVKIYSLSKVRSIARQAYANNYLSFYDNKVDLEGFEALVIGEMMEQIPQNQLEKYEIIITSDSVDVEVR
ncbi:MAG: hypothetical protein IJ272_01230 [Clostridia bacterium]|nr:hypothetical protein [Clostridia bacterium]